MRRVKMLDLSEQYKEMKDDILDKMDEVISSSQFILGDNVKQLENDIAQFSNVTHGIGVGNGSDAILIALQAAGVKPGDEVITTPFTFFATAGAIARAGATPVFVDIELDTFAIDPAKIEAAINDKTTAIIPVHLYGQMADMDAITEIANKHNLVVIEDAAQAIGSQYKGKNPGEIGTAATYSFFPTKNLGAFGDGGMIVTSNDEVANLSRVLRVHGSKEKYHHHVLGYNSRLDELQAAILNVKFKNLPEYGERRREKAAFYSSGLQKSVSDFVTVPVEAEGNYHVYHQYTLRVERRDELKLFLKENGIDSMVYYPLSLHAQPVFNYLPYKQGDFPKSELATEQVISLPIYPELKQDDQVYIIEKITEFYKGG
ncbi:DegT/DnrJ/EryC1/StrS family aminotransferase [Virgibacillus flavescens]|uniref:DegT/DnrJ/EryC1/StrS family aminotransferase n=1 Tax=Virgibacillus flavescens TaxID=1611422 RepID=UPI003D345740